MVYLKGEVFLRHIAEADHDDSGQYLGDRGIDMELFYEQLDEDDVQSDTNDHQHEIPEQLYPAMQGAARKSDMPVQKETGGKADAKGNEDRSNGSRDSLRKPMEIDMDIVLMEDIIETEPIHHDVQQRARTPARRIPKGLQGHDPAKRWIKEINKGGDIIF